MMGPHAGGWAVLLHLPAHGRAVLFQRYYETGCCRSRGSLVNIKRRHVQRNGDNFQQKAYHEAAGVLSIGQTTSVCHCFSFSHFTVARTQLHCRVQRAAMRAGELEGVN